MNSGSQDAYQQLGVSAKKEDVHRAVALISAGLFPGAFCRVAPDILTGDSDWCCCLHADDAGTKAIVAYLAYRESGDASAFAGIAQDALVMNLDDLLCIGATGPFVLSNTINRHSKLVKGDAIAAIIQSYQRLIDDLAKLGIEMVSTGGETADMNDSVRTIIVGANLMARLKRSDVVDNSRISAGDAIVGLSSTGQASYESTPNSGIGDNGLTLARHALLHHSYLDQYPEAMAPETDRAIAHRGPFRLSDKLPDSTFTVGEALLSPTRTYAPVIKRVLSELGQNVHGIVHCTGGGQTKCLHFGQAIHYIKDNFFEPPALFRAIAQHGNVAWPEMYQTFNLGHRMEVFLPAHLADVVIKAAQSFGIDAKVVGRCEKSTTGQNQLTLQSPVGTFTY